MFHAAFADMKNSKWGQLGVCRLFPEWADMIQTDYRTYEERIFIEVESESFAEGCSFEEYKQNIIRYLMVCSYEYSEEDAISLVDHCLLDVRMSYWGKEPVANVALNIGYACG